MQYLLMGILLVVNFIPQFTTSVLGLAGFSYLLHGFLNAFMFNELYLINTHTHIYMHLMMKVITLLSFYI